MERLCDLLFELSNEDRLKILFELRKENLKLSHISRRLDFSVQETSRNIARLVEAKLATRTTEGEYEISPYGAQAIRLIPGYQFLSKHSDYFYMHSLENLPQRFASRIGELIECKPVSQLMDVFGNIERVFREADEYYIYIGEPLGMSSTLSLVLEALDRGVKARGIEPLGYEWPSEIRESVPEETWLSLGKHIADKSLQRRYLDNFDVTFLMNEKEVAILNFLNPTGEFEYMGFTSSDEKAVEWCKDVFEYYWERVNGKHP
jgi:predicted transcriptional regulator